MLDDIRFTKTYATLPLIFTVNDSTIEKAACILVTRYYNLADFSHTIMRPPSVFIVVLLLFVVDAAAQVAFRSFVAGWQADFTMITFVLF